MCCLVDRTRRVMDKAEKVEDRTREVMDRAKKEVDTHEIGG